MKTDHNCLVIGRTVLALLISFDALCQQGLISGRVTDESGEGIAAVNVVVKGTTLGTVTNVKGQYILTMIPNDESVLVFSSIGYATLQTVVGSRSGIDVQMTPDVTSRAFKDQFGVLPSEYQARNRRSHGCIL